MALPNNTAHGDATWLLERLAEDLAANGQWELAANYLHFRQDAAGPHLLTELLCKQPVSSAVAEGVQHPSAKRCWKLIHTARASLDDASLAHVVAATTAKTAATFHWPDPLSRANPAPMSRLVHRQPALCAFWLLEASCLAQLLQLSEQLVEDVLVLASSRLESSGEARDRCLPGLAWGLTVRSRFVVHARDFEAVDSVLARAVEEGLQQCVAFHNFYSLWKQQLQLQCTPIRGVFYEQASQFAAMVVRVLQHDQVCSLHQGWP